TDWLKERKPEPLTVDPPAPQSSEPAAVFRLVCLDRCLTELPPEGRSLILEYYQGVATRLPIAHESPSSCEFRPTHCGGAPTGSGSDNLEPCLKKCGEEGFQ